jgi:hypothetical protein
MSKSALPVVVMRRIVLAGLTVFLAATAALHGLQPSLSPRDEAVSYYVHGAGGGLLTAGLLALGLASVALVGALRDTVEGPGARLGRGLLGIWSVGVVLGAIFPADPPGRWTGPPSLAGIIHGNAALAAFVALPVGALCLARSFRRDPRWAPSARLLRALAVACAVSLPLFFASLVPVFVRPGPPVLLGLSERVLLALYVAWLASVALALPDPQG